MTRLAAFAAPVLLLVYGLSRWADGLDGDRGNGLAWDAGHVAFFLAFVSLAALVIGLRRMTGRPPWLMNAAAAAALFGAGCFLWVIAGDLSPAFNDAAPLPEVLQLIGPVLFQLGALTLLVRLAAAGRLPFWTPALVLLAFVAIAVDLDLIPVAAVLLGAGLAPVAIRHETAVAARR
jgi:hypothetical protein